MDKRTLIIAASFLGISLVMFFLMAAIIKNFLATKKKVVIYVMISLAAFSLVALLGYQGMIPDPGTQLAVFQICLLGLGMLHVWTLPYYSDWNKNSSYLSDLIFSLFIWLVGLIPFYLVYSFVAGTTAYQFHMLGSALFFMIPVLFQKSFLAALSMPHPDMEQWFYPIHATIPDPGVHELQNPFVITFVIRKKAGDSEPISFRAKAPAEMKLSRLFYYFIEDYNDQYMNDTLDYSDDWGQPYGWIFYFKPNWYRLFSRRYADPSKTIKENNIIENSVIVCERRDVLEKEVKALEGEVSSY